jgi:hypothetical protein
MSCDLGKRDSHLGADFLSARFPCDSREEIAFRTLLSIGRGVAKRLSCFLILVVLRYGQFRIQSSVLGEF